MLPAASPQLSAGLLRQLIDYDYKFPAERSAIDKELSTLNSLSSAQLTEWFRGFSQISLSPKLERLDWVNQPALFLEQESAHLWTTHQMDAFSAAATAYGERLGAVMRVEKLPVRRLGIAVIGEGVTSYDSPLFLSLRPHGTYFNQVKPDDGLELLLAAVEERAQKYPLAYGHWYVDGGQPARQTASLTTVSYSALAPVRDNLAQVHARPDRASRHGTRGTPHQPRSTYAGGPRYGGATVTPCWIAFRSSSSPKVLGPRSSAPPLLNGLPANRCGVPSH